MTHADPTPTELALLWPADALQQFAACFAQALGGQKAGLWLQDPGLAPGMLKLVGWYGVDDLEVEVVSSHRLNMFRETLARRAQEAPFIQLVWTSNPEELGETERPLVEAYGSRTVYCCALRLPDHSLGVIYTTTAAEGPPQTHQIVEAAQVAQALTIGLHRQMVQQQAQQHLEELEALLQYSPDMIISTQGTTIVSANPATLRILGYPPERLIGQNFMDYVHPEDLQATERAMQDLLQNRPVPQHRNRWLHQDGHPVHLEWNTHHVGQGKLVAIARDITRQVEQEARLRESEQRFKDIADQVPVMISLTDREGNLTFASQYWLDFTGLNLQEMQGLGWLQTVHPQDRDWLRDTYRAHFQEKTGFETVYRALKRDGSFRWMLVRGSPRFGPEGAFIGFLGTATDIHDKVESEQRLQENQQQLQALMQAQQRFVADAAHELRTPLTTIQGNIDILIRHPQLDPEERRDIYQDIQQGANRLRRLVQDMLQLARGEQSEPLHFEDLDLGALVLGVWNEISRVTQRHNFVLEHMDRVVLCGDPDRLKQLVLILLENAIKYTPAPGTITLNLLDRGQMAELRIRDTGVGIPQEDLIRVFERFYRADQSRTRGEDPGGNGLGLSIAKWIVESHKGHIWMESTEGEGTAVVVQLPR